jgi:SAM-dependent methyltransferase
MGVDGNLARFLVNCHRDGVSFRRTITLGRLNYFLGTKETRQLIRWAGIDPARCPKLLDYDSSRYVEPLLETLGAEKIESLDAAAYEGATIVHDLNLPVPEDLKGGFDVVLDGGTIEHVFNFPVAIRNCMEMVSKGGHLILCSPGNNLFGHGFYQFSPELWFRLLSRAQGFEVRRMVGVEYSFCTRWFEVADPEVLKSRVFMANRYPFVLLILARKIEEKPLLAVPPQQSDYVPCWEGQQDAGGRRSPIEARMRRLFLETFPGLARALENYYLRTWFNRKCSLRNRRFFKPVKR